MPLLGLFKARAIVGKRVLPWGSARFWLGVYVPCNLYSWAVKLSIVMAASM